jgi:flagellar hook-associated protein 2
VSTPVFTASGLASGLDSASLITQLVQLESQPITSLRSTQSALRTQVSQLGSIASAVAALQSAAHALARDGVVSVQATSTHTSFGVSAQSSAAAGSYDVSIDKLAIAAKQRSGPFAAGQGVQGGTLHLETGAAKADITVTDGESLQDLALAINQAGVAVTASVLSDGTSSYLSVSATDTGFPIGGAPADALTVSMQTTGATGTALVLSSVQDAENAWITVDKLPVESRSNQIAGAISGVTISAKSLSLQPETLVLTADNDGTASNLGAFVSAYNSLMNLVAKQLNVSASTDRTRTLAGDSTLRDLQQQMQKLFAVAVPGLSGASSLPAMGLTTDKDGTLSVDTERLTAALQQGPSALNAVFATATTGIGSVVDALSTRFTDPVQGALVLRQSGLNGQISGLDDQATRIQARVDAYHDMLVKQFTAMESLVSKLKSASNYLQSISVSNVSGGSK